MACRTTTETPGFNEAAGIHRRKRERAIVQANPPINASMRPPEFTGGNLCRRRCAGCRPAGFNEAAGIHRRKHRHYDPGARAAV